MFFHNVSTIFLFFFLNQRGEGRLLLQRSALHCFSSCPLHWWKDIQADEFARSPDHTSRVSAQHWTGNGLRGGSHSRSCHAWELYHVFPSLWQSWIFHIDEEQPLQYGGIYGCRQRGDRAILSQVWRKRNFPNGHPFNEHGRYFIEEKRHFWIMSTFIVTYNVVVL